MDRTGLGDPLDGGSDAPVVTDGRTDAPPVDAPTDAPPDAPGDGCPGVTETCNGADDDCDGEVDETFDLDTDVSNCGECDNECPADPANASPVCNAGECDIVCDDGFADCDGMTSNGCEADLGTASTCGDCSTSCSSPTPVCEGSPADGWSCTDDCSGGTVLCGTTCVDTDTSVSHCGGCDSPCPSRENASRTCTSGTCGFDCDTGFGDCDGAESTGCEADLTSDATCGDCSTTCGSGETCMDGSCVPEITVSDVDYTVIAHGGTLTVTGSGFTEASSVDIGGESQSFTAVDDATITIDGVPDATPTGSQTLTVAGGGSSDTITVTVIHLVVNEVDVETNPGPDDEQFVEVSTTGVAGVSLEGYTLVLFDGSDDESYLSEELTVSADSNGYVVVGNDALSPAISIPEEVMEDGPAAVAIYQGPGGDFPDGTAVTATGVIDAVVYSRFMSMDDDGLLDPLLRGGSARVQLEGDPGDGSFSRCGANRRDGRAWETDRSPSAWNDNDCP